MKRAIITPASLAPEALAELKQWLAISVTRDDAALTALLHAGLELCEDFTGTMPLEATCEELVSAGAGWQVLATRPIQAVTGVDAMAIDGTRTALPAEAWQVELDADGGARVRVAGARRAAVRFVAGLAADWAGLPEALRHGVIRYAAYQYRSRETEGRDALPSAIAALWRPWRRLRLG